MPLALCVLRPTVLQRSVADQWVRTPPRESKESRHCSSSTNTGPSVKTNPVATRWATTSTSTRCRQRSRTTSTVTLLCSVFCVHACRTSVGQYDSLPQFLIQWRPPSEQLARGLPAAAALRPSLVRLRWNCNVVQSNSISRPSSVEPSPLANRSCCGDAAAICTRPLAALETTRMRSHMAVHATFLAAPSSPATATVVHSEVAVSPARSASQPPNRSCSTNGNCTSLTAAVCSRTAASGQPASLPPLTAFPVCRASPSSLICDQISCRTSGSDRFPSMRWPALAITPSIISTRSGSTPRSNLILAAPSLVKPSAMMSRRISEVPPRRVNPGRLRQRTIQHAQDRRGHGRP